MFGDNYTVFFLAIVTVVAALLAINSISIAIAISSGGVAVIIGVVIGVITGDILAFANHAGGGEPEIRHPAGL